MNDIKNTIKHILGGILIAAAVLFMFGNSFQAVFAGLQLGITVEVCQFLYHDNFEWKLNDRIPDTLGYVAGSMLITGLWLSFFHFSFYIK